MTTIHAPFIGIFGVVELRSPVSAQALALAYWAGESTCSGFPLFTRASSAA